MVSLKNKKGFTIVELLIVIVVIGILATLVIVTFTGIQQKGRNTQRQTDIKALNGYVESFYAEYGFYPTAADLNTASFRTSYLKGLDPKALSDPKQANDSGTVAADDTGLTAVPPQYSYVTNGDSAACSATTTIDAATRAPQDNGCTRYTLKATMEGKTGADATYTKESN